MSDKTDFEAELASVGDVINQELRIHGPIEVEQYNLGQLREGVRKLTDYLRAKVERRESETASLRARLAEVEASAKYWMDRAHSICGEHVARAEKAEARLAETEKHLTLDSMLESRAIRAEARLAEVEAISEGRRETLFKKAEELKAEWTRAQKAEADLVEARRERDATKEGLNRWLILHDKRVVERDEARRERADEIVKMTAALAASAEREKAKDAAWDRFILAAKALRQQVREKASGMETLNPIVGEFDCAIHALRTPSSPAPSPAPCAGIKNGLRCLPCVKAGKDCAEPCDMCFGKRGRHYGVGASQYWEPCPKCASGGDSL